MQSVFGTEMMTGWGGVESGRMPFSRQNIALLEDLGYSVNYQFADPYTLPQQHVTLAGVSNAAFDSVFV
ncbi:MAG: hypothetical protein AB7E59_05960 [Pusillimonas sp.]